MGQMVAVTETPSAAPGVVRYELNRTLTGMGHEHFVGADEAVGPRPAAELARRFFATGQVGGVHVFSNIVTVELARGGSAEPLAEILRTLYQYWQPGMEPPSFDDLQPDEGAGDAGSGDGGGAADAGDNPAMAAARKVVPAHLLERGSAARERYRAKSA